MATAPSGLDLAGSNVTLPNNPQFPNSWLSGPENVTNSGANATLTEGGGDGSTSYTGTIADGAGTVAVTHTGGTTIFAGTNTYTGATTINGGTLQAGAANTFSAGSAITINTGGTLDLYNYVETINTVNLNGGTIAATGACSGGCSPVPFGDLNNTALTSTGGTFAAGLTGTSSLTVQSGVTVFSRSALSLGSGSSPTDYTGATTILGGTLKGGSVYSFSALTNLTVAAGGTFDLGGYSQIVGSLSGAGTITSTGNPGSYAVTLMLYDGSVTSSSFSGQIKDGESPVALSLAGTTQSLTLTGTNNTFSGGVSWGSGQTLSVNNAHALGTGVLTMNPNAILAFTGTGYTLANPVVFLQSAGPVIDSGSGVITMTGVISDSGGPSKLDKAGSGTLILNAVETYTGGTEVHAGTLLIGDSATPTANVLGTMLVDSGATLGGAGTASGAVTVTNGGILSGSAGQTLTMGSLTLNATSNIDVALGAPSATGLFKVNGALTLGGSLNITDAGGFGAGVYRIIDYTGALTNNGLAIGTTPAGVSASSLSVQTAVANQVNLVYASSGPLSFWNGTVLTPTGSVAGGAGTWKVGPTNWSDANGATSGVWSGGLAVFEATPGAVTIDNSGGAVSATGLQFAVNGYTLGGGALTLTGAAPTIRVGDGTAAGAGYTATISAVIAGSGGLIKTDLGTLVLSGAETYTGATTISAGTLSGGVANAFSASSAMTVSAGATLDLGGFGQTVSALAGVGTVTNGGATAAVLKNQGASSSFSGVIEDGAGATGLTQNSVGSTLTLSGANTYSGATTVSAGTLQGGAANTFSAASVTTINTGGTLDLGTRAQTINTVILNGGTITQEGQPATNPNYDIYGTLTGNVTSSGGTISGNLVGASTLTTTGGTTLISYSPAALNVLVSIDGMNTYSGATNITGGTLKATDGYLLSTYSAYTIAAGATLDLGGGSQSVASLSGAGTLTSSALGGGAVAQGSGPAILSIYGSGSTTFSGQITDGGAPVGLSLQGTGQSLTLTGTNNSFSGGVTIGNGNNTVANGDTVSINNANAIGTGLITLEPNATLAFTGSGYSLTNNVNMVVPVAGPVIDSGSGVITMTGVISGAGKLDKQGSGTLILDAVETYTGGTEVHTGTLTVGDQNTLTAVLPGAVQVDAGATLAGYGTVTGNLSNLGTVQPGGGSSIGTLTVSGNYTQASSASLVIAVTPAASSVLKVGGTASLAGTVTFAYAPGTYAAKTYTFLNASSVSGTFSTVTASSTQPVPTGFKQSVTYDPTSANLVLAANAPIAPADRTLVSSQIFAFSQLNEDAVAGLLSRSLANGGGNSFYNIAPLGGPEGRAWMRVLGSVVAGDKNTNLAGLSSWSGGMETGIDFAVGAGGRLGGAIGYESSSLTDIYGGKANEDIVRLSLYGSQTWGPLGFSGVLSYAHGWADSHRAAGIGLSSASRGDDALVGAAQVSAPWSIGSIVVTPAAGVTVSNTGSATFVEQNGTNAAFAVTGTVASQTVVSPYAVVGLSSAFTTAKGATITPDLQIGYRHASEGGAPVTLTAADSTVFTGNQINPEPDSALVGASITAHRDNWTAFVKYRGSFAGDWSSETVSAGLRISF